MFLTLISVIILMGVDIHWIYEPERLLTPHSISGFVIFFLLLGQMGLVYSMIKQKWPEKLQRVSPNFLHGIVGHVLVLSGCM